ncbi:MAG TPA: hypothetical protein HA227_02320, partial [Candidatus Diapherotrites archaeon]|nr:hypothetical protein [Candidatus Diapherotrites archaeon]
MAGNFFKFGLLIVGLIIALAAVAVVVDLFAPPEERIQFQEIPRFKSYEDLVAKFSESQNRSYGIGDMLV